MLDSGSSLTVGQIVPDYELLRRIGGGSYGEVWLARSRATGVLRAAKIVWRHTFEEDRPFNREFEGIQRFERISREHPSQLALFHIGRNEEEGFFYYVMELADNVGTDEDYVPRTLRAELRNGRLVGATVVEIGLALAEALEHLHQHGLVHRDIKPSNVIFVNGRPKLADIGLVADASDTRSIVGTEGYLPPEGPGTPQADIFAFGKVLYEAATGLDRREYPKLPDELRKWPDQGTVVEVNEIVLRATASNPARRYKSCDELRGDLSLVRHGKSLKSRRIWLRRRATGLKAGIVVLSCAIVGGAIVIPSHLGDRELRSPIPEVNNLVQQGNLCVESETRGRLEQAARYFQEATKLDPKFAPAYFGLFRVFMMEGSALPRSVSNSAPNLRACAKKLIEIAPGLAESRIASSYLKWLDGQYKDALAEARQATAMPAGSMEAAAVAHIEYGYALLQTGDPVTALHEYEKAERLLPSYPTIQMHLGHPYFAQRKWDLALQHYQKSLDMEPRHVLGHAWVASVYEETGQFANAIEEWEKRDLDDTTDEAKTRQFYAELREAIKKDPVTGYWRKRLEIELSQPSADAYDVATYFAHLNDTDAAYKWLEKACAQRHVPNLMVDVCWDHNDERFKTIARKVGLSW